MAKRGSKAKEQARAKARKAARDQAKRQRSRGSGTVSIPEGMGIYKPPEDATTVISILPFVVGKDRGLLSDVDAGDLYYKVAYKTHRGVGPEDKVVVCLATFGKTCPVCEEFHAAKQSDKEYEEYKALKSTDRDLMLIANKGKLELLEIPWFWFGKPLGTEIEEDEGDGLFFFPEDEVDLKVTWETDSYGTKATRIRFIGRKEDLDEELVEQAQSINLAECVVETDYNKMYAMFHGTDIGEEVDKTDEEEAPGLPPEDTDMPPSERKLKKLDGQELLDVAKAQDFKIIKKIRRDVEEEDEDAIETLRELLLEEFYPTEEDDVPPERDDDDDEEEKDRDGEDKPKTSSKKKEKKKKKDKGKCPEGYEFGTDNDAYDECDDCGAFTECEEAK